LREQPAGWSRPDEPRGTQNKTIDRSRGGLTTKIVVLIDALGNLVHFVLLPSQRHDSVAVDPLITRVDFEALISDKAFDSDRLHTELNERGAAAAIPPKVNRVEPIVYDDEMYKWRPSGRKLLLRHQGVSADRYSL